MRQMIIEIMCPRESYIPENLRDDSVKEWHRKNLPRWCYASDVDLAELRENGQGELEPAAWFEFITSPNGEIQDADKNYIIKSYKLSLLKYLNKITRLPTYIIWHHISNNYAEFLIKDISTNVSWVMNENEFKDFLMHLRLPVVPHHSP